jgi:hypothetical protein
MGKDHTPQSTEHDAVYMRHLHSELDTGAGLGEEGERQADHDGREDERCQVDIHGKEVVASPHVFVLGLAFVLDGAAADGGVLHSTQCISNVQESIEAAMSSTEKLGFTPVA